ncbi:MAG: DNA glycosylase AlkZ-like family protein [Trebonia sp.]
MATVHQLSRQDARRVAVRAQMLTSRRPPDLLTVVRRLTMLQLDPVSAVAPSADLVAWSRLGAAYQPDDLKAAIARQSVIELRAFLRPAEDFTLYRADMAAWPGAGELRDWQVFIRDWVAANDRCRRDILARLAADGPLQSRELPDTCEKPWQSTGWTNNKNVTRLLESMVSRGEVAVAGRKGRERLWDLAERVYPDHPVLPLAEAERERNRRRLAALGIARHAGPEAPMEPAIVGESGEPAEIEGVKGHWRVDPSYLDGNDDAFAGRAALLSPFDRLVHDRVRALEIFGYEYQLEMYKPAGNRRWGYYALPILYGDRLVGKLDAVADRKAGVLTVNAVHQDVPFTTEMAAAVDEEIAGLAAWLGLEIRRPR